MSKFTFYATRTNLNSNKNITITVPLGLQILRSLRYHDRSCSDCLSYLPPNITNCQMKPGMTCYDSNTQK